MASDGVTHEVSCKDVITACDKALEGDQKALEAGKVALKAQKEVADSLAIDLDDAKAKLDSPLRNPFLLGGLGILGGVLNPVLGALVLTGAIVISN